MMNIILTSYNRPALLRRTITSLLLQTDNNWKCYLMDDDSDAATLAVIREFSDRRIIVKLHETSAAERIDTTRYSVLINEILPTLKSGIVGYLCDNVEYDAVLVSTVNQWFKQNPDKFAGYVYHMRDVCSPDGLEYKGMASDYGHWNILPPGAGPVETPAGLLDHSQVFHRLPIALKWNEDPAVKARGDGEFFTKLVQAHGPIYPIDPQSVLTFEHLIEDRI